MKVEGRSGDGFVSVLLVDDHTLFREGLAGLLTSREGIQIVGHTAND